MDWTDLMEDIFQMGTLTSLGIVVFGGWLFFKTAGVDKHKDPGINRPKTLGWRE